MQLFTHLLSSYLQGMGDFFSALLYDGCKDLNKYLQLTTKN